MKHTFVDAWQRCIYTTSLHSPAVYRDADMRLGYAGYGGGDIRRSFREHSGTIITRIEPLPYLGSFVPRKHARRRHVPLPVPSPRKMVLKK